MTLQTRTPALFLTLALIAICLFAPPTAQAQIVITGHYDNNKDGNGLNIGSPASYSPPFIVTEGATFNGNSGAGLFADGYTWRLFVTVNAGVFSGNKSSGLLTGDVSVVTINGGTFSGNQADGLRFGGQSAATINGGTFSGNQADGLRFGEQSSVTINGGTFSGNVNGLGSGLGSTSIGNFTVKGGVFSGNSNADFFLDNATNNDMYGYFDGMSAGETKTLTATPTVQSFHGRLQYAAASQTFTYAGTGYSTITLHDVGAVLVSARMVSNHVLEIKVRQDFGAESYKVQIEATINAVTVSQTLATSDTQPFDIDLAALKVPRFKKNQRFTIEADTLDSGNVNIATDKKDAVILLPVVVVPGIDFGRTNSSGGDGTFTGLENSLESQSQLALDANDILGDRYSLRNEGPVLAYPTLYTMSYNRNNATFAQGADAISSLIVSTIKQKTYADAINLVGHSKGCLVARKYLVTAPQPAFGESMYHVSGTAPRFPISTFG